MKKALAIILCSFVLPAFGEYRVYQYYIRSKVQNINAPKAEVVTSTLNPVSYAAYHGGKASIDISLLRSWVCLGYTAHSSVCTISEGRELEGVTQ